MSSSPHLRFALVSAGAFGFTGVALGAFGAHKLEPFLTERGMLHAWETAARYHLIHAVALLGIAAWQRANGGNAAAWWAARCWSAGILLFSGSLYLLAIGGPRWLGPITPVGGLALLIGWGCVLVSAFTKEE